MANSLLTGISGLRGRQKMLEVVGNNLANLNTTAFKSSRVLFSDLMYEVQRNRGASSSSSGLLGSVNAIQIGTGSEVSQVDMNFQQGNLEQSGKPTDLAIDGSGFFVTKAGDNTFYTRSRHFHSMQTAIWLIRQREISCSDSGLWVILMGSILHFRRPVTPASIFLWVQVLQGNQHSRSHCPATCIS